ncbi:DoxX family protein [Streptomyces sp. NPDC048718]|uniref:DoxX family protein n=1 Tax=Streptomyces sp. NPDC048718 TaxID=3365587 RepID=UPI00371D3E75
MSVDTRTPRPGFDDQPALSMLKVDCDPAQVIVNHASFRVRLAPAHQPKFPASPRIAQLAGAAGLTVGTRRRPVVWTGKSSPAAAGLLQAVRDTVTPRAPGAGAGGGVTTLDPGTRAFPRFDDTMPNPVVPSPPTTPLLPPMRRAEGAYDNLYAAAPGDPYDEDSYDDEGYDSYDGAHGGHGGHAEYDGADPRARAAQRHGVDPVRHAYYPGRRMNLGVVLLPLRVFLGCISVYAGMGKLCDPVYFDGGERGSLVKTLHALHPWPPAEPLRDFALQHPVGSGLTVAFLQIIVGVLTALGLWQRIAAAVGAVLSAALILTLSWKSVPAYETPDIIYLAAWSPLIIAGAPVYSLDGRLAGEAWRTLGPRSEIWELRRRVLRRGTIITAVVIGVTLLVGSVLGGAVRSTEMVTVPGPNDDPVNHLPGRPLPHEPGAVDTTRTTTVPPKPAATSGASGTAGTQEKSAQEAKPTEAAREPQQSTSQSPTATQGTGTPGRPGGGTVVPPPVSSTTGAPAGGAGGSTGAGGTSGAPGGASDGGSGGGSSDGGSSSGGAHNPIGGLLG